MFRHHDRYHPNYRPFRWLTWIIAIVVIVLLVVLILNFKGCPKSEAQNKTEQAISGFDGINIYTLDSNKIIEAGKPAIPYLAKMLENESSSVRWAAVTGLAAIGHQLNASNEVLPHLKKAMDDSDISVRVTAAELVMSFHDKDGIPVLISALDSEEQMKPSEPPMPVKSYCAEMLVLFTGQDYGTDKAAWQSWWDENKDNLNWNSENEKFTI